MINASVVEMRPPNLPELLEENDDSTTAESCIDTHRPIAVIPAALNDCPAVVGPCTEAHPPIQQAPLDENWPVLDIPRIDMSPRMRAEAVHDISPPLCIPPRIKTDEPNAANSDIEVTPFIRQSRTIDILPSDRKLSERLTQLVNTVPAETERVLPILRST